MRSLLEIGGRRLPMLRWSAVRMVVGMRKLAREWQVGDGREAALEEFVLSHARAVDLDDAIRAVDEFCETRSVMMNVGDEKGEILDHAVERASPRRLLELGAYCGYSGLRMARIMPVDAHLFSVEFLRANAEIARRIWEHAGVGARITAIEGSLGDGGETVARLCSEHGFGEGSVDFVFIDHDKAHYLPDLERIVAEGWLHPGSIVVADNVKFPGAPEYREHMRRAEGTTWRTIDHDTHVEYQSLLKDLVLESEYLGAAA